MPRSESFKCGEKLYLFIAANFRRNLMNLEGWLAVRQHNSLRQLLPHLASASYRFLSKINPSSNKHAARLTKYFKEQDICTVDRGNGTSLLSRSVQEGEGSTISLTAVDKICALHIQCV